MLLFPSEALMEKPYTDIDYDSFPVADLNADRHWIFLPASRWDPIYRKMCEAREQKRLAALPKEHKIILVPADPIYSPTQVELWPILNETIQQVIAGHPDVQKEVHQALSAAIAERRGWRNPFPARRPAKTRKK